MEFRLVEGELWEDGGDILVVPLVDRQMRPFVEYIDERVDGLVGDLLEDERLGVCAGAVTDIFPRCGGPRKVVFVGLGGDPDSDSVRDTIADVVRKLTDCGEADVLNLDLSAFCDDALGVRAAVEGAVFGAYHFDGHRREKREDGLSELGVGTVAGEPGPDVKDAVSRGEILSRAACFARDLVNEPANYLTPVEFARRAEVLSGDSGLCCRVMGEEDLEAMGLSVMLGVSEGSSQPARLIQIKYDAGDDAPTLAIVGKGLTFDSGGISLKGSDGMQDMKMDMGGAAAVLAAMSAISRLEPQISVVGLIAAVENMPDGAALKPGDVRRACDGRTVEIISTDAEGRLVLADTVAYVREHIAPDWIVDVATLTGSSSIVLGDQASPVVATDDDLADAVGEAGSMAGERFWQLPTFDEYREQLKSEVADLKNSGGRKAGVITGGLFIGTFADDLPWAHLDIACVAWTDKDKGWRGKGGTGFAARTLAMLPLTLQ